MNTIQQIDYWWCLGLWTSERSAAVNNGYHHIYIKDANGSYRCLSNPEKIYKKEELLINRTATTGGYLLSIEPEDGNYPGTMMEYNTPY